MATVTVNVSFPKPLIKTMDAVAKQEARSRSELLREGVRLYLERKRRWEQIFAYWHRAAREAGLKPQDVGPLIAEVRARRRVS